MDKQKTETLEQRIGREAVEWRERWEVCRGNVEDSDIAAVRPLVERIVKLEIDAARETELAKLDGAEMAEMRDKLTAAQAAGRDQASEIERLRGEIADATETIKGADENRRRFIADIIAITKRADDAEAEAERLTTTIDVLAGRVAELTGRAGQ